LTEKLRSANRELERSNEDLQQFFHVASHDLREPLRKIETFTNRVTDEFGNLLTEKPKQYLSKVQSAIQRMYAMIGGVLSYSAVDAVEDFAEVVDLNLLMENIKTDMEVLIEQKSASLSYADLPKIKGIKILLYQLFYNLINNSFKFSKQHVNSVITVTSQIEIDSIKIWVEDNGIGFEPHQATLIFDTFKRLNSKDKFEGTGLGLALCKKIVERHGGSIEA
jgi:light-regulated signal transduction histidine kinase (bacteriophytochrome)